MFRGKHLVGGSDTIMLNFNILMENPLKDETVHSVIRLIVPNKEILQTLDCIWDKVIDYLASFYYIQQD